MIEKSRPLKRVLVATTIALLCAAAAHAAGATSIPTEPLISVWSSDTKFDIAPVVKAVGFNTVWTHDEPDHSLNLAETLMGRHLQAPGVKYVIAKINRSVWGWTHEHSLRHADWVAKLSLTDKRIIGVYLNDFYGEIEAQRRPPAKPDPRSQGGRTPEQWREIIARVRAGNPELAIWLPCYPRMELDYPFDYDFDAVMVSFYGERLIPYREEILSIIQKKFKGKPIMAGLYCNSGTVPGWLTEEEFKGMLATFVRLMNEGRIQGLRIFNAGNLEQRPEYAAWAKEAIAKIKRR